MLASGLSQDQQGFRFTVRMRVLTGWRKIQENTKPAWNSLLAGGKEDVHTCRSRTSKISSTMSDVGAGRAWSTASAMSCWYLLVLFSMASCKSPCIQPKCHTSHFQKGKNMYPWNCFWFQDIPLKVARAIVRLLCLPTRLYQCDTLNS